MPPIEHYIAPRSLAEALECLQTGEVTILAGGTDLMPQNKAGRVQFKPTLMNIRHLPELSGIRQEADSIWIGALTSITAMLESELLKERLPILVEASDHFASNQIRNAGTLGGNICNASPAGDTLVPLIVLGAEVELAAKDGKRALPIADFFTGPGKTKRAPTELLTGVRIPLPAAGHVARFFKFGTRPALDISAISIGIAGVRQNGGLSGVRIAFGAVAPTPIRAPRTEAALEGRMLDEATIAAAAELARDEATPIDDLRASAWYRKELIHNMMKRMLGHVAQA